MYLLNTSGGIFDFCISNLVQLNPYRLIRLFQFNSLTKIVKLGNAAPNSIVYFNFQYQIISATYSDSKGKFNNPNTLVV